MKFTPEQLISFTEDQLAQLNIDRAGNPIAEAKETVANPIDEAKETVANGIPATLQVATPQVATSFTMGSSMKRWLGGVGLMSIGAALGYGTSFYIASRKTGAHQVSTDVTPTTPT